MYICIETILLIIISLPVSISNVLATWDTDEKIYARDATLLSNIIRVVRILQEFN